MTKRQQLDSAVTDMLQDVNAKLDASGASEEKSERVVQLPDEAIGDCTVVMWGRNDTGLLPWDGVSRTVEVKIAPKEA